MTLIVIMQDIHNMLSIKDLTSSVVHSHLVTGMTKVNSSIMAMDSLNFTVKRTYRLLFLRTTNRLKRMNSFMPPYLLNISRKMHFIIIYMKSIVKYLKINHNIMIYSLLMQDHNVMKT